MVLPFLLHVTFLTIIELHNGKNVFEGGCKSVRLYLGVLLNADCDRCHFSYELLPFTFNYVEIIQFFLRELQLMYEKLL